MTRRSSRRSRRTSTRCSGGRPHPIECYLRLMFLKFRYRLGYESLCAEVSDSISWRRFCRIGLDAKVPHPTTLMKLTTRCGEGAVAGLNEALWAKAAGAEAAAHGPGAGRYHGDRARTWPIRPMRGCWPRRSGKLVRAARRVQAAGGATGTVMTDRRRAAGRRARAMAATMRARAQLGRDESSRAIRRVTGDLARPGAKAAAAQAAAVLRNGRRAIRRPSAAGCAGRLRRALGELAVTIERTATVVAQARSRLAGQMPDGATRLVSLHDPDARPIRKGRIDRPGRVRVQGPGASTTTTASSWITPSSAATAPDAPAARAGDHRIARRAGRTPRSVTADRGYGEPATERDLQALGVRTVAIPAQSQALHRPPRRRACPRLPHPRQVAHRLRRPDQLPQARYGWDRTRLDGRARSFDLVRARGIHPQPGQDQRPRQLTCPGPDSENATSTDPRSASSRLFQGEVI